MEIINNVQVEKGLEVYEQNSNNLSENLEID